MLSRYQKIWLYTRGGRTQHDTIMLTENEYYVEMTNGGGQMITVPVPSDEFIKEEILPSVIVRLTNYVED